MADINPAGDRSDAARDELLAVIKQACGEVVADMVETNFKALAEKRGVEGFNPLAAPAEIHVTTTAKGDRPWAVDTTVGATVACGLMGLIGARKQGRDPMAAAVEYAEKSLGAKDRPVALKALSASKFEDSGFLIPDTVRDQWIELLYPNLSVLSLGPQILPMPTGKMTLPKQVTGTSYSFVGEAQEPAISQPTQGGLSLSAKKGGIEVAINNDLVRRGGPRVANYVQDLMVKDASVGKDLALLRGLGTEFTPRGLYYFSASNVTATNSTTPAFADILSDLGKVITAQETTNLGFNRAGWIVAPRVKNYMMFNALTALGLPYFMEEIKSGTIMGYPYRASTQVPVNLGGGANESWMILANFANVLYAETMNTLIKISDEASYKNAAGTLVSAFGQDQTVIQLLEEYDLGVEYNLAVHRLDTIKWGA